MVTATATMGYCFEMRLPHRTALYGSQELGEANTDDDVGGRFDSSHSFCG
jgi:hypothetical protein